MAKGAINLQKESGGVTKITSIDGIGNTEVVLPERGNIVSVDTAVTDNAIARYDGATGKLQNSGVMIEDNNLIKNINSYMSGFNGSTYGSAGGYFQAFKESTSNNIYMQAQSEGNQYILRNTTNNVLTFTVRANGDIYTAGSIITSSPTGALGYGAGAGGTVTQLTSKSTAVTLNKPTGKITTASDALAAGASVVFIVNNSTITSQSVAIIDWDTSNYRVESYACVSGSFVIRITNITGSSRSEALDLMYTIIKGETA